MASANKRLSMKVLFHTNTLNYRGTAVAVRDYARYNQEILGNESIISFDASLPYEKDMGTEPEVLEALGREFEVIPHNGKNLQSIIDNEKIDASYFLRSGNRDWLPDNCHTIVHSVFQLCEPHGDRYGYISQWLSETMGRRYNKDIPYVPHMVNLPEPKTNLREQLGIKPGQTVIGRIGGYETFDLMFVKLAILRLLNQRDDFVFVFVGTNPWIDHPNVKYVEPIHSLQVKSDFINSCDVMLHARSNGESFGLAIAEGLSQNKPVLAWELGDDRNHTLMLKGSPTLYNEDNFADKLLNCRDLIGAEDYSLRTQEFLPEPVMRKFQEVFL